MKRHILTFLGITAGYLAIMDALGPAHLLMSLVADSDKYEKTGYAVTAVYIALLVWFIWRIFTGIFRRGDFLD